VTQIDVFYQRIVTFETAVALDASISQRGVCVRVFDVPSQIAGRRIFLVANITNIHTFRIFLVGRRVEMAVGFFWLSWRIVNMAAGFFWLSWRIVNMAVGFFWFFCGIFLVILWDFSG